MSTVDADDLKMAASRFARRGSTDHDPHAYRAEERKMTEPKVTQALFLIDRYGGIDGDHHKQWVLDQVVRVLAGDKYEHWVRLHCEGEDGPETYSWDTGIAP